MPDRSYSDENWYAYTMEYDSQNVLKTIDFEEGIIHIGDYSFGIFTSTSTGALTSVQLPSTLESIGKDAFCRQTNLKIDLVLPEGFTTLGAGSFSDSGLTSVTFPVTLTEIPDGCFSSCGKLVSVSIPNSMKTIGQYAFSSCGKLETLVLNPGLDEIKQNAFYSCTGLKEVTVPIDLDKPGVYDLSLIHI